MRWPWCLLEARGFRKEDFARFHPGGRLGRTLLFKVHQIMRGPERMARVAPGTPVREALHEMARARAGSAVVVEEDGVLAGVFTHGDFGRHFQRDPDLLEKPVGEVMTRNPISIAGNHMAAEVLQLLQQHPSTTWWWWTKRTARSGWSIRRTWRGSGCCKAPGSSGRELDGRKHAQHSCRSIAGVRPGRCIPGIFSEG